MKIPEFEELAVTTMTLIASLRGTVEKRLAFLLLPLTSIKDKDNQIIRRASKSKLPLCHIPGAIISLSYRGKTRGIVRNSKKSFKNGITIDICIGYKNINLKLSMDTIQMCGAKSMDDAMQAIGYIVQYLNQAQDVLEEMMANPEETFLAMEWVKKVTRGMRIEQENVQRRELNSNVTVVIVSWVIDHEVVHPLIPIPSHLNKRFVEYLLSLIDDFTTYNDYRQKLDSIMEFKTVILRPFEMDVLEVAMVNYNYSLGFEVDRNKLDIFIDQMDGFVSRYDNAISNCVTIDLPYTTLPNEYRCIKRKKGKIPHHTFLVYRSGSVTQSGPGGERMRQAYYLFMKTISLIEPEIKYMREL